MSAWGPAELAEVFLHDVPADIAASVEQFNGVPGPGMFREPWPLNAWPDVPTRVLAPSEDRLFPVAFQRRVARERLGLPVEVIPGGHVPMLARPGDLAERLAGAGTVTDRTLIACARSPTARNAVHAKVLRRAGCDSARRPVPSAGRGCHRRRGVRRADLPGIHRVTEGAVMSSKHDSERSF